MFGERPGGLSNTQLSSKTDGTALLEQQQAAAACDTTNRLALSGGYRGRRQMHLVHAHSHTPIISPDADATSTSAIAETTLQGE